MKKAMGLLFVLMAICTACAPQVTITAPEDGATFDEGGTIVFKCEATDRKDGDLSGESVVWYADSEDTILGTGTEMATDSINRGDHTIMVKATNSAGKVGSDKITITIGQGGSSTTTTLVTAPSTATIGKSGGTIAIGKARLEIPAGALDTDTQVSISEVEGKEGLLGPAYDLQPNGLQFITPATLIIDYSKEDLPVGYETDEVAIVSLDEHYQPPQDNPSASLLSKMSYYLETAIDQANTSASAQITHFSSYGARAVATVTKYPKTTTKWFIHPVDKVGSFDEGQEESWITTFDGRGVAFAEPTPSLNIIWLNVETFQCSPPLCGGDVYAMGLLAKIFRVKPDKNINTPIPAAVGCTIVDVGGASTGNCNIGERRLRLMDLGTGIDTDKQVPVQVATAGDEWSDMPQAATGTPPTPHIPTQADGKTYLLEDITLTAGHYYTLIVDLWAISGTNTCDRPEACCPSSQRWGFGEFNVDTLLVTM
jgi:hypothetical protein